jgi:hypothetical protein
MIIMMTMMKKLECRVYILMFKIISFLRKKSKEDKKSAARGAGRWNFFNLKRAQTRG